MIDQTVSGIKKIVVGSIIANYGALQIVDGSKQDLKLRVNKVINGARDVENYFKFHPNSDKNYLEVFKEEFKKDELLLLSEIFELLYGLNSESLENIHEALKNAISESQSVALIQ